MVAGIGAGIAALITRERDDDFPGFQTGLLTALLFTVMLYVKSSSCPASVTISPVAIDQRAEICGEGRLRGLEMCFASIEPPTLRTGTGCGLPDCWVSVEFALRNHASCSTIRCDWVAGRSNDEGHER